MLDSSGPWCLAGEGDATRIKDFIADTIFGEVLMNLRAEGRYEYEDEVCERLRNVGCWIKSGEVTKVGIIQNKNGNHWYVIVVDMEKQILGWGDSLGGEMTARDRKVLTLWLSHHLPSSHPIFSQSATCVPIPTQFDSHSCLLFAHNALRLYFGLTNQPLGLSIPEVAINCVDLFCTLVELNVHLISTFIHQAQARCADLLYRMVFNRPLTKAPTSSSLFITRVLLLRLCRFLHLQAVIP